MASSLQEISRYLNELLKHEEIVDYAGAQNGLHLENSGKVQHLSAAVDANKLTLGQAASNPSTLLIVHHGLAWNGLCPLTGHRYHMITSALHADLALFSSHLPLDAHSVYGNNIQLARQLGFQKTIPYLEFKGTLLAQRVEHQEPVLQLAERVKSLLGAAHLIQGGPQNTQCILISSGSGKSLIETCANHGIDTLITGEVSHDSFSLAHDLGINLILGGHYATETLGVKALTQHLSEKFNLPWTFIDEPSGL